MSALNSVRHKLRLKIETSRNSWWVEVKQDRHSVINVQEEKKSHAAFQQKTEHISSSILVMSLKINSNEAKKQINSSGFKRAGFKSARNMTRKHNAVQGSTDCSFKILHVWVTKLAIKTFIN